MIQVHVDSKSFGGDQILGSIDFKIPANKTIALLGSSGVGKSTLLRLIAGLDTNFRGEIQRPRNLSMMFQEPNLLPWRNTLENITLITGVDKVTAQEALSMLNLLGKANHFPGQLSLGQQRRLALARALAAKPEFLIMDEPFTSLDEPLVLELLQLTKDLLRQHQVTTLFVTHSSTEAEFLADEILYLEGKPAQLVTQ